MVGYKLTYFANTRSRCEATRLAFQYGGLEYEEILIDRKDWYDVKKTLPYGHVPILEVEGKGTLCESGAMARFIGKKFGLCGKDDWEAAKIDELVDYFKDVYSDFGGFVYPTVGLRPGDPAERKESVARPAAAKHFPLLSKTLWENGSGFLIGDSVSIADFFHSDFLFTLLKMAPDLFDEHEDLKEYVKRVQSLPQLAEYIRSRPDSPF